MVKIQHKKVIIYKSVLKFKFFALCEKKFRKILKCDEKFINLKKDKPLRAGAVNLATFANVLCHCNATPLSVAVLAPCVWGENLACGIAWQSTANSAKHNTAWRGEFGNETAKRGKIQWHSKASTAKMGAVFGRRTSLSLSLSLVGQLFICGLFLQFFKSFCSSCHFERSA